MEGVFWDIGWPGLGISDAKAAEHVPEAVVVVFDGFWDIGWRTHDHEASVWAKSVREAEIGEQSRSEMADISRLGGIV